MTLIVTGLILFIVGYQLDRIAVPRRHARELRIYVRPFARSGRVQVVR